MFKIIKEILSSLSVIKARIFFIFILSLIVSFLELINLGLIIPIINKFVGGDDFINYEFFNFINELSAVELAVAFVFIIFVKFIFTSFNLFFVTKTGFIIREYWTNSLLKKILKNEYHIKENKGKVLNDLTIEPLNAARSVMQSLNLISTIVITFFVFISLLIIETKLSISITLIFLFYFFVIRFFTDKYSKSFGEKRISLNREFISLNSEIIKNLREIKLYNYINYFFNEERFVLSKYTKIHTYFILITKLPGMANEILVIFSLGLIFLINNYFGEANLSLLSKVAFLGYGGLKINNYLNKIIEHRMKILSNFPSFKSVIDKLESKGFKSGNKIYSGHIKTIVFKNVCFSYSDKKVIDMVNLTIKRGQKIFIYGDSGVGKSTFLDLLSKNLKPTSGKITVNNMDLLDLNTKKFRESISYIPQEPFFFRSSIKNNIFLDKTYDKKYFNELLKKTNCDEFINKLKNKEDYVLQDEGSNLSGGQLKRIAIVRALIRKPEILLLDEVTNGLDPKNTNLILKLFLGFKDMTLILVSHDKKLSKRFDKTIKLSNFKLYTEK